MKKKELGAKPLLSPMPVLMIATYNEDGTVDVMNMAWGGICAPTMVSLNIGGRHRTAANIKRTGSFTLSVPSVEQAAEADWFGIASGNDVPDKFSCTGMHAVKSTRVDAPVIEEFPVTLECRVVSTAEVGGEQHIVGEILNTLVDQSCFDADGNFDVSKIDPLIFSTFDKAYYAYGRKVGPAWGIGRKFEK